MKSSGLMSSVIVTGKSKYTHCSTLPSSVSYRTLIEVGPWTSSAGQRLSEARSETAKAGVQKWLKKTLT